MTYLTANTIQFTRSYLSFCGDLLKVYTPDRQHLITSAFTDILTAHVSLLLKAVASEKYRNEVRKLDVILYHCDRMRSYRNRHGCVFKCSCFFVCFC